MMNLLVIFSQFLKRLFFFNLRPLNLHVSYEHFKMEHLISALGLMEVTAMI